MKNKFYITTPVYYANASPHIGHAYTTVATDVIVRYKKLIGKEAFLLTGMDEHGAKIVQKANNEGKKPQELVDEVASEFKELWEKLGINYSIFTRTTNANHKKAIQTALQKLYDDGAIYKGEYEGLYCVGCEQFKNESDLVNGKCPDHDTEPEILKEESYMLKMSEKQEELIAKIESDEFKIRPKRYKKEILSFLQNQKLADLSISRQNVSWGIELPFDSKHTAYVWFDAFLSYVTGLDWNGQEFENEKLKKFWPADVNLIGKDILRVHATIWPIMLMHLGLPLSRGLFVHGHILSGGKKMSKTLGNVISVDETLEKFGAEATRYLLLSLGSFGEDVDMTMERMTEKYNADLANGLGNLLSRVVTLSSNFKFQISNFNSISNDSIFNKLIQKNIEAFKFNKVLGKIWEKVSDANKYIEDTKPWELAKNNENKFKEVMQKLTVDLSEISVLLKPFMPKTAEQIKYQLKTGEKEILFKRV